MFCNLSSRGTFKRGFVLLFYDTHFVKVNFNPVITVGMVHIAVYHALPPVNFREFLLKKRLPDYLMHFRTNLLHIKVNS